MKKKIKKILKPLKYLLLIACAFGIFLDIFIFKASLGLLTLFIFILWLLTVWLFEFSAKISFFISFAFLAMTLFSMVFKVMIVPNKITVWLYLFLFWGTLQQLFELRKESGK